MGPEDRQRARKERVCVIPLTAGRMVRQAHTGGGLGDVRRGYGRRAEFASDPTHHSGLRPDTAHHQGSQALMDKVHLLTNTSLTQQGP